MVVMLAVSPLPRGAGVPGHEALHRVLESANRHCEWLGWFRLLVEAVLK